MKMKRFLPLLALATLVACAPPTYNLQNTLAEKDIAWSRKAGRNTVKGQAVMRTVGGDTRTCAGLPVFLVPDSAYTRERMQFMYGNLIKGYNPAFMGKNATFVPDEPLYRESMKQATCDAQGDFTFSDLPNGTWYVVAPVVWKANPNSIVMEGGSLMSQVAVSGGTKKKIVLAPY